MSPRITGTNTPLKIYSYLRSGRPIVATDLRTHTQVLEPGTAVLVPPDPTLFAAAVGRIIDDPAERDRVAAAAAALASCKYDRASDVMWTREAYARLHCARALRVPRVDVTTGAGTGSATPP